MSMPALLRLLETVAKSIKHAMAMSTILATEIFQARHDAVLATSKLLLDKFEPGSGHMWESQVLLTDGQVVFLRVLRFSPTFDERSARYK